MINETIGDRIRRFRGKALTQKQLADLAGVEISVIRKLEQNRRQNATSKTLHKIAEALDVDIADLVGKRYGFPSEEDDAGVVAIRRALTSVDDLMDATDDGQAVSLVDAQRTVSYAWGAYWNGRYELLSSILPSGLIQVKATANAAQHPEIAPAHEQLARMYWVTGCTLVHLGQADPAFIAIRHALNAAERGNDPLLAATLRGSVAWQLLVSGRFEESHAVALKAAASIEPRGDVSEDHLSVHGSLVLQGATAAGRGQRVGEALHLAGIAGEIADRIGADTKSYECNFGPSQKTMQQVDIEISNERYVEALETAKAMPNRGAGLNPVSQARHLVDRASALTRIGHLDRAQDAVKAAERIGGPEWSKHQTLMRQVVGELLEHERPSELRELAKRIGLTA